MERNKTLKIASTGTTVLIVLVMVLEILLSNTVYFIYQNKETLKLDADNRADEYTTTKTLHLDFEGVDTEFTFKLNKPVINTNEGDFDISGTEIIAQAVNVLNTPYDKSNSKLYSDADLSGSPSVLDCSGLVQWSIAQISGTFKGLIKGFNRESQFLPRSCNDWLSSSSAVYWAELGKWNRDGDNYLFTKVGGNTSIRNASITYRDKGINVLKVNDPITNDLRYWEYFDENGEKQELPTGAIIISAAKQTIGKTNHAWMYIGNLHTSDIYEARIALAELLEVEPDSICSLQNTETFFKQEGGDNEHWMIETGGVYPNNVTITNKNPNAKDPVGNKKQIGPIWAFQIANNADITGEYYIDIAKRTNQNWYDSSTMKSGAKFTVTQKIYNGQSSELISNEINIDTPERKSVTFPGGDENGKIIITEDGLGFSTSKYDVYKIEETEAPEGTQMVDLSSIEMAVFKEQVGKNYQISQVELYKNGQKVAQVVPNPNVETEHLTHDVDGDGRDDIAISVDPTATHIRIEVSNPETKDGSYKMNIAKKARSGSVDPEDNDTATFSISQFLNSTSASKLTAEATVTAEIQSKEGTNYEPIEFDGESTINITKPGTDFYWIKEGTVTGNYIISPNWQVSLLVNKVIKEDENRYEIDNVTLKLGGRELGTANVGESIKIDSKGNSVTDSEAPYYIEIKVVDKGNGVADIDIVWTDPKKGGLEVNMLKKEVTDYKNGKTNQNLSKTEVKETDGTEVTDAKYQVTVQNLGLTGEIIDWDSLKTNVQNNFHSATSTSGITTNSGVTYVNSVELTTQMSGEAPALLYAFDELESPTGYATNDCVYFVLIGTKDDGAGQVIVNDAKVYYVVKDENGNLPYDDSDHLTLIEATEIERGDNDDGSKYIIGESEDCKFRLDFDEQNIVFTAVDTKLEGSYNLDLIKKSTLPNDAIAGLLGIEEDSIAGATYIVRQYLNAQDTSEDFLKRTKPDADLVVTTQADGKLKLVSGYITDANGVRRTVNGEIVDVLFENVNITDLNNEDVYYVKETATPIQYKGDSRPYYIIVNKTEGKNENGKPCYQVGLSRNSYYDYPAELYYYQADNPMFLLDHFKGDNEDGSTFLGSMLGGRIDYDTNTIVFTHLNKEKEASYTFSLNKVNELFKDSQNKSTYKSSLIQDTELKFDIDVYSSMNEDDEGIVTFENPVKLYTEVEEEKVEIPTKNLSVADGKITLENIIIDNKAPDGENYYFVINETSNPKGFKAMGYRVVIVMRVNNTYNSLTINNLIEENCKLVVTEEDDNSVSGTIADIVEDDGILIDEIEDRELANRPYENKIDVYIPNTPIIDLALKKTITSIKQDEQGEYEAVETANGFNVGRESGWEIDTTELKAGTGTNAKYTMNKTPVKVKAGDKVQYSIRIFNEGGIDAKASQIKDYIPVGLKLIDVKYVDVNENEKEVYTYDEASSLYNSGEDESVLDNIYEYDEANGVLTVDLKSSTDLLPAYDKDNDPNNNKLSSNEIRVICEVTESATGILTNVSEISEYRVSGGIVVDEDIDSTPNNWKSPNGDSNNTETNKGTEAWRNYATGASGETTDGEWHNDFLAQDNSIKKDNSEEYKQGDDDDFDKLEVKAPSEYTIIVDKEDENGVHMDGATFATALVDEEGAAKTDANITVKATTSTTPDTVVTADINSTNVGTDDYYTIEETETKIGYVKLKNKIGVKVEKTENPETFTYQLNKITVTVDGTEYVLDKDHTSVTATDVATVGKQKVTVKVSVNFATGAITVIASNKPVEGGYTIIVDKEDENGVHMDGATFATSLVDASGVAKTDANITVKATTSTTPDTVVTADITADSVGTDDYYTIEETETKTGYVKLKNKIGVKVEKTENPETHVYQLDKVTVTVDGTEYALDKGHTSATATDVATVGTQKVTVKVSVNFATGAITVIASNKPVEGGYTIIIDKEDENGAHMDGATFATSLVNESGATKTDANITVKATTSTTPDTVVTADITADSVGTDDYYTIEETDTKEGYVKLKNKIGVKVEKTENKDTHIYELKKVTVTVDGTDYVIDKDHTSITATDVETVGTQKVTVKVSVDFGTGAITVIASNESIKGEYEILLNKVDENGEKLSGVKFKITGKDSNGETFGTSVIPKEEITTEGTDIKIVDRKMTVSNYKLDDTYTIQESSKVFGYLLLEKPLDLTVSKKLDNTNYVYVVDKVVASMNGVTYADDDNDGKIIIDDVPLRGTKDTVTITIDLTGNTIKIVAQNKPFDGSYNILVNKKDEKGNYMKDVKFTTVGKDSNDNTFGSDVITSPVVTTGTSTAQRIVHKAVTLDDYNLIDTYTITEEDTDALIGYYRLADSIEVTVEKEPNADETAYVVKSFKMNGVEADENDIITLEVALDGTGKKATITATVDENDLTIMVENKEKIFDLSLRKFITRVNDGKGYTPYDREPTAEKIDLTPLTDEDTITTTAIYNHSKEPVLAERGNTVVYTIRVFNEGERDGYATEITDHLPESLEFVQPEFNEDGTAANINAEYGWSVSDDGKTVKTSYLKEKIIDKFNGKTLDYEDVQIECLISRSAKSNVYLTNIAEITGYDAENHTEVIDIDNKELVKMPDDLPNYNNDKLKDKYVPGQEDDDDFEKVYIDLKGEYNFTVTKKDAETSKVIEDEKTTFDITVYGKITEETDENGTKVTLNPADIVTLKDKNGNVINTKGITAVTNGVASINGILITDIDAVLAPYYFVVDEVQAPDEYSEINYRVVVPITFEETEKEYIAKHETTQAFALITDSEGNEYKKSLREMATNENECASTEQTDVAINVNVPNKLKDFDLSLRKFITRINDEEIVNSREPQVDASKLASGESTTATYEHPKDPILVSPKDIVEYTIRIYNEGEISGYATLVMDDIPDGVEMIEPGDGENNTSKLNGDYRWKMYRRVEDNEEVKEEDTIEYNEEKYVITSNPNEAVLILTDYLSKENGEAMMTEADSENPNLLQPFNSEVGKFTEANYRDVKVQFKVKPSNEEGKIIINYAQITDDSDKDGNPVKDRDSTTNEWIEGEDDQDIEKIKVRYFDLALYKWVTTAVVTEDGKTTEYDSKHTAMNKVNMVDVVIPKNKLNKVTVKFRYQIRVENQGNLEGYAKEVKDHIPAGLKFVAADNTEYGWVEQKDGTITTDYLKDTLLKPGETAEVTVVLTWINSATNLGQKVNYAEISDDFNVYGAPDIDSTPNNFENVPQEDDEDGDVVMLQIRTGMNIYVRYLLIAVIAMMIITAGSFGIKRLVLNRR